MEKRIYDAARNLCAAYIDPAAARAEMVGGVPATPKQCFYLASLMARQGLAAEDLELGGRDALTKSKARRIINELA